MGKSNVRNYGRRELGGRCSDAVVAVVRVCGYGGLRFLAVLRDLYDSYCDYLRKLKSLNMQITYSQYGLLAQVEIIKFYRFSLPLGKI
ncbi:hypothetical protein YC2023_094203 [Brassica napus]